MSEIAPEDITLRAAVKRHAYQAALDQLRAERADLDQAIAVLERRVERLPVFVVSSAMIASGGMRDYAASELPEDRGLPQRATGD